MPPFTVHWSRIPDEVARTAVTTEGVTLFAVWPSPVTDDVCFREAGFTDFGDGDESWDAHMDGLLVRLLDRLNTCGEPHLLSPPVERQLAWYRRPFTPAAVFGLKEQLELSMHRDELPDCVVAFGESGVSLRTGNGHPIFWITLPEHEVTQFPRLVEHVADSHPLLRTDLKWEHLV